MLEILHLINVQRHTNLVFEFSGNLNTITGASDAGKSSVMRALRWLLFNKPANLNIWKRNTKKTEVICVIDGHKVSRARTKTKNTYALDGVEKKGFGKGVPEEIASLIDMEETLHYQRQIDPYFLVSLSSGSERAKAIEKYTDLSLISRSIANARKALHHFKTRFQYETERIQSDRRDRKALINSVPLKDSIKLMFSIRDTLTCTNTRLQELIKNCVIIRILERRLDRLQNVCLFDHSGVLDIKELENKIRVLHDLDIRCGALVGISDTIYILGKSCAERKAQIADTKTSIAELEELMTAYKTSLERLLRMKALRTGIMETMVQLDDAQFQMISLEKTIKETKVCPTCKRPL